MPMIPSLVTRLAASDRLAQLKEISLRIASMVTVYSFHFVFTNFSISGIPLSDPAWIEGSWAHRQYWEPSDWTYLFDRYLREVMV